MGVLRGIVLAFLAVAVRLAIAYLLPASLLPSTSFFLVSPLTASTTWREAVYWSQRFGEVPVHLGEHAPKYLFVLEHLIAYEDVCPPQLWLSLMDGLTVFVLSSWGNLSFIALLLSFVLNPLMAVLPALQSLASLEYCVIVLIIECCRLRAGSVPRIDTEEPQNADVDALSENLRDRFRSLEDVLPMGCAAMPPPDADTETIKAMTGGVPWVDEFSRSIPRYIFFTAAALGLVYFLGISFAAVRVAIVFPVGSRNWRMVFGRTALASAFIGWNALSSVLSRPRTTIYAPPDNGVMWYVRQLILPSFEMSLDAMLLQLPTAAMLPLFVGIPPVSVPNLLARGIPSPRTAATLFAVLLSFMWRIHIVMPDCVIGVIVTFSLFPRSFTSAVGVVIPAYAIMIFFPLQIAFHVGWIVWEVANGNWLFFAQVGFMVSASLFVINYTVDYFRIMMRASGQKIVPMKKVKVYDPNAKKEKAE